MNEGITVGKIRAYLMKADALIAVAEEEIKVNQEDILLALNKVKEEENVTVAVFTAIDFCSMIGIWRARARKFEESLAVLSSIIRDWQREQDAGMG